MSTIEGYSTNTVFTVQISDGGLYIDIPTKNPIFTYGIPMSATIPADVVAGRFYSVRVKATNPDVIGMPSPTRLLVRGGESKPAPPLVDSLTLACDGYSSKDWDRYIPVKVKLIDGAEPRMYVGGQYNYFSDYAHYPYCESHSIQDTIACKTWAEFDVYKNYYNSPPYYVYPLDEKVYYVSQLVDGCESERVQTKVRILWRPWRGPAPANPWKSDEGDPRYGRLSYCQGEKAYPLNMNGHGPAPDNYRVVYYDNPALYTSNGPTFDPPVPDTRTPNVKRYMFSLEPMDPQKGCSLNQGYSWSDAMFWATFLTVTVNPTPSKPTTATMVVSYYQGQVAMPLSATTTDSTASLVWYGTDATGGEGSSVAPKPATNQVGPATYYVAQKIGSCESERVPVSVLINPLLGIEDPTLAEVVEVFPNPTVSSLTIRIRGLTGQQSARLELVDLVGQSLYRKETQQETAVLPMTDYPNGSYLLLINVGDRKTARRIMKL
ncbi:T9SS type A sorting domain-containing protein [Spirosoma sp.]|uniref:T9SS type A sorting domain-containing protein n=2 Tax=unclassified Spirosoma TaxID=2621999 RepID=UPI001ACC4238|nr:T9SS type A sorting domain-containing protein [Spirosoma sp.]MBN8823237.1 T9SS type A sorting domain-containing protein [Spirosoma sp.]